MGYFDNLPDNQKSYSADKICPACKCKVHIYASGEDAPGFHYHDHAHCHCGYDFGEPYSNPMTVFTKTIEKHPDCKER